ncbi:hypothetical protein [Synechococcus sp. RSCCF101]|uniref:hypothetical protein n=1 Tax=Synechococcus sp. RSCCF101 TaxID=2511069 RepID=UPI001782F831|nr:hypothetical protein [Synechococcus sp. RSCCF101]
MVRLLWMRRADVVSCLLIQLLLIGGGELLRLSHSSPSSGFGDGSVSALVDGA